MRSVWLSVAVTIFLGLGESVAGTRLAKETVNLSEFVEISKVAPDYAEFVERTRGQSVHLECRGRAAESYVFQESISGEIRAVADQSSNRQKAIPRELMRAIEELAERDVSDARDQSSLISLLKGRGGFGLAIADFLEFDDGWMLAFNYGEWGGGLIWINTGGYAHFLDQENTSQLLQVGDVVYAAQGLEHLGPSSGGIRKVIKRRGWEAYLESYSIGVPVEKIVARNGAVAGLTRLGVVYVSAEGVVAFNAKTWPRPVNVVQSASNVHLANNGDILVGGLNMIGVYPSATLTPKLYVRRDCDVVMPWPR